MTSETRFTFMDSPLGTIAAAWNDDGVVSIRLGSGVEKHARNQGWREHAGERNALTEQLSAYFAGELQAFDLRVVQKGTEFQREVWGALAEVPYGETRSYADIAVAGGLGVKAALLRFECDRVWTPVTAATPRDRVAGPPRLW